MQGINRLHTDPVRSRRTMRNHNLQVLTSFQPGKCVPVAAIPLLREDSLSAPDVRVSVEMSEMHELLVNNVNLRVTAYVVPFLAFDRFEGSRDQFDRSYMGQKKTDDAGAAVVPFFETSVLGATLNDVYKALGLHGKNGDTVNTMYLEAYNQIINMRLRNRSPNLAKRGRLDATLAPAFWLNSQWRHVVPDFDQAVIDGEVALNILNSKVPVKGIGLYDTPQTPHSNGVPTGPIRQSDGTTMSYPIGGYSVANNSQALAAGDARTMIQVRAGGGGFPDIYAELLSTNATISLADIAMARKAQAFAKIRERFQGITDGNVSDEYIIDMLMSGLEIPDQSLKQPMLIADVTTKFAQAKRYASDYANMAESAVSGAATVEFDLRVPRLNTGGVVMIIAEAMPDQLFERQADPFFYTTSVAALPETLRDTLDVQKVDIVQNRQVDVDHATPAGTFGYEPMNNKWNRWGPRIGGKFHKPSAVTNNDAARERLWAIEQANPALGTSFYLVPTLNYKPFLDTVSDPFEATVQGNGMIQGNTVFGGMLVEQTNLYAKVIAKNPTTQAKA